MECKFVTKRILLIDDVKDLADTLAESLKVRGYDVDVCYNGQEAFDLLKDNSDIDLVITDIIMPGVDGIDVINHIRDTHVDVPIIAMSGGGVSLESTDISKIVDHKVTHFIQKPVCIDSLLATVTGIFL